MLSINTNLSSLIAQGSMKSSTNKLNQAIERMTTGFKINHAKDNAANYSISTNMTTKIGSYNVAEDNALMGLDLISTAEGTLDQIQDKLQRLRALAEQASNGTYGEQSLNAINAEANAIVDEIERLYNTAEYNGLKLFGGSTEVGADVASADPTNAATPISTFSLARTTNTSNGFIQEITQLSEEEAIAQGYTVVKTADELQSISGSGKYILMNNIDLSGVEWTPISSFSGELNGNGYEISNLSVEVATGYAGFLGSASGIIKNLGFSNANVVITYTNDAYAGIIAGKFNGDIINCYAKGDVSILDSADASFIGGFVGSSSSVNLSYSYFEGNLLNNGGTADGSGNGGLVGKQNNGLVNSCFVQNSEFSGNVFGGLAGQFAGTISNSYVSNSKFNDGGNGIVAAVLYNSNSILVENCYVYNVTGADYAITGISPTSDIEITSCSAPSGMELVAPNFMGTITNSSDNLDPNNLPFVYDLIVPALSESEADGTGGGSGGSSGGTGGGSSGTGSSTVTGNGGYVPSVVSLQIGTGSDPHSNISFNVKFSLEGLEELRNIGLSTPAVATFGLRAGASPIGDIERCDEILATIQAKQTEFGAVSNRLESVLEEITIQRDNLVSSRSTIRDADIAEVSSHYIQQQILQQASATLLATANQSPSIALQLI